MSMEMVMEWRLVCGDAGQSKGDFPFLPYFRLLFHPSSRAYPNWRALRVLAV